LTSRSRRLLIGFRVRVWLRRLRLLLHLQSQRLGQWRLSVAVLRQSSKRHEKTAGTP